MPTNWVMKQIGLPPPKADFRPQPSFLHMNKLQPPRISLRKQARIRRTCIVAGVDPASIGLPSVEETNAFTSALRTQPHSGYKTPADVPEVQLKELKDSLQQKLPKGRKVQFDLFKREKKIHKNMSAMPETIARWEQDQEKASKSTKPTLPF
ncbi:hypothetical protein BJ742DRAFT_787847 [Cladochytrium replicatum]|nr:hypothetical protein BJ742DRAFT_787847 [Cladochytrium replicatum]